MWDQCLRRTTPPPNHVHRIPLVGRTQLVTPARTWIHVHIVDGDYSVACHLRPMNYKFLVLNGLKLKVELVFQILGHDRSYFIQRYYCNLALFPRKNSRMPRVPVAPEHWRTRTVATESENYTEHQFSWSLNTIYHQGLRCGCWATTMTTGIR